MVHNESLCGLAQDSATAFPTAIGLAATFQPHLIEQMAGVASREARAVGINHVLSPVLDVNRDARWGRVHETYGEDPFSVYCHGHRLCPRHADRRPGRRAR